MIRKNGKKPDFLVWDAQVGISRREKGLEVEKNNFEKGLYTINKVKLNFDLVAYFKNPFPVRTTTTDQKPEGRDQENIIPPYSKSCPAGLAKQASQNCQQKRQLLRAK